MNKEAILNIVHQRVSAMLADQPAHFLVDVRIKPTNNIKVFLDGDNGIGIDDLAGYNKALYKMLEEENIFPDGNYSLELSSAGLDEPFRLQRQYIKNIGRQVQVVLQNGTQAEGKLTGANEQEIIVQTTRPKEGSVEIHIPHTDIKTTKIVIKF